MTTDGQRILARGVEVRLSDGVPRRLRFDLDALEQLETDWGSLEAFAVAALGALQGFKGRRVRVVRTAIRAGLSHLELASDVLAGLVTLKVTRDNDVVAAIVEAWLEAVPLLDVTASKAEAEQSESTGPGSTTSAPSSTAAATVSGAV